MFIINRHCIYLITNKINGNQYVGQTINFEKRMKEHCRYEKQVIDKAIKKYGKNNFKFEIIEDNIPSSDIDSKEIYYINEVYNTYKGKGYNCHVGGNCQFGENNPMYNKLGKDNPRFGLTHSKKSREKISKNHVDVSGKNNPNYGKRGFKNPNISYTVQDIFKVFRLRLEGFKYVEISARTDINEDTIRMICLNRHSVCKQIDFNFNLNDFNNIFNKRCSLSLENFFLVKLLRKKGLPQEIVSNLFNVSKSVINTIDMDDYKYSKYFSTKNKINSNVNNLIKNFREQYNSVVQEEKLNLYFFEKTFSIEEWFENRYEVKLNPLINWCSKYPISSLTIKRVSKLFEIKSEKTYNEVKQILKISPSIASNIINEKHWINEFFTKDGKPNKLYKNIIIFLNKIESDDRYLK